MTVTQLSCVTLLQMTAGLRGVRTVPRFGDGHTKKRAFCERCSGEEVFFLKDFNYFQTSSLFKIFVTFPVIISLSSTDFKFHILIPPNSLH